MSSLVCACRVITDGHHVLWQSSKLVSMTSSSVAGMIDHWIIIIQRFLADRIAHCITQVDIFNNVHLYGI